MSDWFKRWSILVLALLLPSFSAAAAPKEPLRDTEVLALVVGGALPVNVVHEISARGIAFIFDETFRSQLKAAGADATILAALKSANISVSGASDDKSHRLLLQQLVTTAQKMNAKKYDAAAVELNSALDSGQESPAVGFAMGEVLRATQRYSEAVAVYAEVLKQDPDFPEAHTKLSYNLYRTDEAREAVREAKLAITANPRNPEAHQNLALALESLHKFAAAAAEYRQALRLKPDYVNVLRSCGRPEDAAHLEKRAQPVQSSSTQSGAN